MRLAVATAFLLLSSTAALAQPGATQSDQSYGPPPPAPAPTYGQPYAPPAPAPAPTYGQPYAPAPAPAPPQPYPQQPQQPYYPQQPSPPQQQYPQQQYPQQYPPYQQQQQPVGGLTRPLVIKEIKSPGTARLLSIGVTGVGFLGILKAAEDDNEELGWASVGLTLFGPSAGHVYAGEGGHALKMTLLRTGGLLDVCVGCLGVHRGRVLRLLLRERER